MRKLIQIIKEKSHKMKLSQRMTVVYVIGCFLPLLFLYLYTYSSSRQDVMERELTIENERLERQAEDISRSMGMAMELSEKLYFDEDVEKVAMTQYAVQTDMKVNYREFDVFSEYLNQYYEDVSGICLYLDTDGKVDNRFFRILTPAIQEKEWYIKTAERRGAPVWTYLTNGQTGKRSLRLTRILYNESYQNMGVMSITLNSEISEDFIKNQSSNSLVLLNGEEVVHSNFEYTEEELAQIQRAVLADDFNGWMDFRGERCIVSTADFRERYSYDKFMIISIKAYDDVVSSANKYALVSLLPLIICGLVMTLVILLLGNSFTRRVNAFSNIMHRAAEGDFTAEDPEIEVFQDEIWDLNQDLHVMIRDIQKLNETAMLERIQREQLYSRQKDVELKMLAAQINPHFLYNTLENIRMMASINKQKDIADMSYTLTKYLRSALNVGEELKTLAWEMDMVESYIKIQNYRFDDRILAEIQYPKELVNQYLIIPFVIQPFVENAYVHAMEDMESGGHIMIRVEITDELILYVEDNGHGMSPKELEEVTRYLNDFENLDRTHIGICNVNQRIKLKYGDEYGVDFESVENVGTKVKIRMPLINND